MIKLQSGDYDFAVNYKTIDPHFATLMWQNEQSLPHNQITEKFAQVKKKQ